MDPPFGDGEQLGFGATGRRPLSTLGPAVLCPLPRVPPEVMESIGEMEIEVYRTGEMETGTVKVSGPRRPRRQRPCWQICAHGLHGFAGECARVAPL